MYDYAFNDLKVKNEINKNNYSFKGLKNRIQN